ncbi:MAG: cell division regulator GpsB [Bacilli bacterium]|jgi:DivIVA domain-containing protein|nr:cell division regulator GpsB [Bacilli bacterium]
MFLREYERGETMLLEEISLSPQDILEKEFKIDTRGYRPQEVDRFLDLIIADYSKLISMVKKLNDENKDLMDEILNLKKELRNTKEKLDLLKTSDKEITNVDLLRRISQLEKVIYGDKE